MYVYIHIVRVYVYMYMYMCAYQYTSMRVYMCTCMYAGVHIYTHTQELRGLAGPRAPRLCLEAYIAGRSAFIGADRSKSYLVFPAKNKCSEWKGGLVTSGAGGGGLGGLRSRRQLRARRI